MTDTSLDCVRVRDTDAIDRYVRGRMAGPESRAFEEHYFACEDCWAELQTALEARAGFAEAAEGGSTRSRPDRGTRIRAWGALAAAAAAAFVIFGIWQPGREAGPDEGAFRGGEAAVRIQASVTGSSLRADWASHPEAELYRVHLYSEEGRLLLEREVREPRIEVPASDPSLPPEAALYWRVEALDGLRRVVASSSLTPARSADD